MTLAITTTIVTGGRKFADRTRILADVTALLPHGLRWLVHGGHGINRPRPWTTLRTASAYNCGTKAHSRT